MKAMVDRNFILNVVLIGTVLGTSLLLSFCSGSGDSDDQSDLLQIQRRKMLSTKMTMKTVGEALMRYVLDNGTAPDIEEIGELRKLSHPALRRLTSLSDGWGNDLHYLRDEDDEATFYIASAGRDGKFDGWEQEGRYQIIKLDHYNRDVIYSNGGFIYISTQ